MDQEEIDKLANAFSSGDSQLPIHSPYKTAVDFVEHERTQQQPSSLELMKTKNISGKNIQLRREQIRKYNPYSFNQLSDQQKRQTFLSLYEQLIHVKSRLQEEVQRVKKLNTKLHIIENDFASQKKMGQMTPNERIKLEKEKDKEFIEIKNQNRRLLEKINALTVPKRPSTAAKPKNNIVQKKPQKLAYPVNEQMAAQLDQERGTVKSLLQIIKNLKHEKISLEEQLKEKQRHGGPIVNQSNLKDKSALSVAKPDNSWQQMMQELTMERQKKYQLQLAVERLTMTTNDKVTMLQQQLEQERQNSLRKDRQIADRLRSMGDTSNQSRILELTAQRDKLESELRRMATSPFYSNNKDILELQTKVRELQTRVKSRDNEISNLKESGVKLMSQLQFRKKEVASAKEQVTFLKKDNLALKEKQMGKASRTTTDLDDYYRKALNLVKWQGDDPIWRKYSALARPDFDLLDRTALKQASEKLWNEKLQLLAHLEQAQIRLKADAQNKASKILYLQTQKQKLQQKLSLATKRLDEYGAIISMRRGPTEKLYEQAGVKYDDSVSVFSADETTADQMRQLDTTQNYLDLYIGEMILEDMAVSQQAKGTIKDIKNLMSFLTVDFYNHDTDHTQIAQGLRFDFRNRMSFRVTVDETLMHYLEKDGIKIELWGSQGSAAPLLGSGTINLKDLVIRGQDSISPVIRSKMPIYSADHVLIGVLDYRVRMRLPISPLLKWIKQRRIGSQKILKDMQDMLDSDSSKRRRLSIVVERALNLPDDIEAFVYYTLQHQDCYSDPERGPTPMWDFHRQIDINFTQEFQQEIKSKFVEFTIFDDRKPMGQDVYGIAQIDMTPLLTKDTMDAKAQIRNASKQKVGVLVLKAAWL